MTRPRLNPRPQACRPWQLVLLTALGGPAAALAACGGSAPPPEPPASPQTCEEVFADLTRYYAADPDRRRPPAFQHDPFVSTCQELPSQAQRCMLFSYMQAHASACDETLRRVSPELMQRLAVIAGK